MTEGVAIQPLVAEIRRLIDIARQRAAVAVNQEISLLYWQVGHRIRTEVLQGRRAEYGKQIVATLARQLTMAYGKGWSKQQLRHCLRAAETFPKSESVNTVCAELSSSKATTTGSATPGALSLWFDKLTMIGTVAPFTLRPSLPFALSLSKGPCQRCA